MKNNSSKSASVPSKSSSFSPFQAITLFSLLLTLGAGCYFGGKALLSEMPENQNASAGNYMWGELKESVNTFSK